MSKVLITAASGKQPPHSIIFGDGTKKQLDSETIEKQIGSNQGRFISTIKLRKTIVKFSRTRLYDLCSVSGAHVDCVDVKLYRVWLLSRRTFPGKVDYNQSLQKHFETPQTRGTLGAGFRPIECSCDDQASTL